ncbi:hypothetical protein EDC04DRAFT_2598869 [Pisolithus marmoratus]|nr:hypothetical protein EDC04DRAFT_2598869 [Pisolithus marmoratus]
MSCVQNKLPTPPLKSRGRLQRQGKDRQTLNLMPFSAYYRDYTGIEGDIKNATTLTAQIVQSKGQPQFTLPVRTAPGTSSNSASAAPLGASSDSSSPSPENIQNSQVASHAVVGSIPDVGVQLDNLHNDDARKLLCIVRKGETLPLWEIEQIQIQYGVFQDIPWGILGFRLVKGKDAKDCVKVQVVGTIQSKGAEIKCQGIWPPRKANDLAVFQTKFTTGRHFQLQLDSLAKALTSFTPTTTTTEHTAETGQTLVPEFRQHQFEVTLGIKKGSPSGTCVADLAEFYILVQLSKEHIPVVLEVTANVVYRVFLLKNVVQGREVCVYSGEEKEDIRRGIVTTA